MEAKCDLIQCHNALIAMAQWHKDLPFYFARLLNNTAEYNEALRLIREAPKEPARPGETLTDDEWKILYQKTTATASLRKLFEDDGNPFRGADPSKISLLAEISDLKTDPKNIFFSKNGAFHLVLHEFRQEPKPTTKDLITQCLLRFYKLLVRDRSITEEIYKLACTNDWYPVMASLKDGRDYTKDESDATSEQLKKLDNALTSKLRSPVLSLFRVPRKLVKLAWEQEKLFDTALETLRKDQPTADELDLESRVANVVYPMFVEAAGAQIKEIESDLELLAMISEHYLSARKFVKVDGLVYSWPKIASLAMANYSGLTHVEKILLKKKPLVDSELEAKDARELYDLCANNKAVVRFLRLQPHFSEIDENEFRLYRPLASSYRAEAAYPENAPESGPSTTSGQVISGRAQRSLACELLIKSIAAAPASPGPGAEPEKEFEFTLTVAGEVRTDQVRVNIKTLLDRVLESVGVTSEDSLHFFLKNLFTGPEAEEILYHGGQELFNTLIANTKLGPLFTQTFEPPEPRQTSEPGQPDKQVPSDLPVRLIVVIPARPEEEFHFLPWEWFPRPNSSELLLANERFSLVRSKPVNSVKTQSMFSPAKIMGVFPNVPVGARDVSDSSLETLEELRDAGAHCVFLKREEATLERVSKELERFGPQILHFEGWVDSERGESSEPQIFFSESTAVASVGLLEFQELLIQNKVQLLVLGRNESNRVYWNPVAILASRLVGIAVPAILAPIRAVDDATSTAFVNEFYKAFLERNTLEQALFITRRKVASRGADWTSFALFSDPGVLDDFKLLPQTP